MILHIDMDAFYASVEQRDHPSLVGKPVIVGGTSGRGVVSAASYEARGFGVHSAMPASTAKRLCPNGIFLSPRMDHYAKVSAEIREIFQRYTPLVEPLSLDEAFLDVRGSKALFGDPATIGERIQTEIRSELDLVASVGVASNKFLAKIASDVEKPNGFVVVDRDRIQEFLDPLPVGRLWGVGKVTGRFFDRIAIRTIGDLRQLPLKVMTDQFGDQGQHLWNLARGIDDRNVVPDRDAKSISHETTFAIDISDTEILHAWVMELADQVGRRLRRHGLRGRTVQLKVRFSDFKTLTRAQSLPGPTDVTREICDVACEMLTERIPPSNLGVRLLGVGVSHFDDSDVRQKTLFDEETHDSNRTMDAVSDKIRELYGKTGLRRGSSMLHGAEHRPLPRPNPREN